MKNRQYIELISLILMTIVATSFISTILAVSQAKTLYIESTSPTIIAFGNDEAIQTAVREIKNDIPNTRIKEINDYSSLKKTFPRYAKYIFYVGHGEEAGLLVGTSLISWDDINALVHNFKGVHQFFVVCYSNSISSEKITTFSGNVDARIAAKVSVIKAKLFDLDTIQDIEKGQKSFVEKVNELISCTTALSKGKIKSLTLGTESGYEFAIQRVQIVKRSFWGVVYDWEEAIYVNMCPWVIDFVLAASGPLLGALALWLGEQIVIAIGVVAGMSAGVWGLIFAVFFAVAMVSLKWNQQHRGGHDAKVGLSFRSVPVPFVFLRYDNTYCSPGGDFIVPVPQLIQYAHTGCVAVSVMPNNVWIGLNFPY